MTLLNPAPLHPTPTAPLRRSALSVQSKPARTLLVDMDASIASARKLAVLVNVSAGSFKVFGKQRLEAALKRTGLGASAKIIYCKGRELRAQAQNLAREGANCVAVLGGDGSARTVALALRGLDVPVLPLPGGTLNRLCHRVHGHADLERILRDFEHAKPVWLSGGMANEHVFLVASGFGPWMAFHSVRETMRADGLWAGLKALRAVKRDLFAGKLKLDGAQWGSDVVIAAPDYVDRAFGFGTADQNIPLAGLEIASARLTKVSDVVGLGSAVLLNRWRSEDRAATAIKPSAILDFGGQEIVGLVDGEKCAMGTRVCLRFVPRAALVLSTRG